MRTFIISSLAIFLVFAFLTVLPAQETKWQELKTTHFIIYYQKIPEGFLIKVKESAEMYYKEITKDLGFIRYEFWLWDKRAKIYIYPDRESYLQAEKSPHWSGAITYFREKKINTFPWDTGFFDTVLPHELGHIIFREFIGNNPTVPLWMDEGMACYQELSKRWSSKKLVKDAISNNTFIPLGRLTDLKSLDLKNIKTVELFYAESVSVVSFLLQNYRKSRFTEFCNDLRKGESFMTALKNNYPFSDLEELNNKWLRSLKD